MILRLAFSLVASTTIVLLTSCAGSSGKAKVGWPAFIATYRISDGKDSSSARVRVITINYTSPTRWTRETTTTDAEHTSGYKEWLTFDGVSLVTADEVGSRFEEPVDATTV